jgi:hypothetical protein
MPFEYVHTTGEVIENNQLKLIDNYVNNYLFSLIQGLRQQNFGFDTLHRVTKEIIDYRNVLGQNRKFFIDSGGYSIIVGDVSPRDISKFIECYNMFLEKDAPEYCDYIFSLDIPIFLKYPDFNSMSYIYEMNSKSIWNSKRVLDKNLDLYNKFIFVWQFKLPNQYAVWKRIYEEQMAQESNLRHFGIGGLVGLRGITGIKFSPFTAMAYKCLKLIYDKNLSETSIIHILGVYGLHDRVELSFLHKLFNDYYLKDSNCKAQVTYDTVNYSLSGLYKLRELMIYIPENGDYICDYAHNLADKLHTIIDNGDILDIMKSEFQKIKMGEQVDDPRMASTLNVVAQTMIDRIIDEELEKNHVLELFIESENFNKFKNKFLPILKKLEKKYPLIFGNRTEKNLMNFQYISAFHTWWQNGQDSEKLEQLVEKFVSLIRFPVDLMEK